MSRSRRCESRGRCGKRYSAARRGPVSSPMAGGSTRGANSAEMIASSAMPPRARAARYEDGMTLSGRQSSRNATRGSPGELLVRRSIHAASLSRVRAADRFDDLLCSARSPSPASSVMSPISSRNKVPKSPARTCRGDPRGRGESPSCGRKARFRSALRECGAVTSMNGPRRRLGIGDGARTSSVTYVLAVNQHAPLVAPPSRMLERGGGNRSRRR